MADVKSKPRTGGAPIPDAARFGGGILGGSSCGGLPCFDCNDRLRDGHGCQCRQPGDDPKPLPSICSAGDHRGHCLRLGPSLCSALLGALAYNFFLTEPRYSLVVNDPADIWAIGLLFVVGLIVSGVAFTSRRRATEATVLRRQAAVLQAYCRDVVAANNSEAIVSITSRALSALFQVPAVMMLVRDGKVVSLERVGGLELQETELEAARSSLATRTVVRAGTLPGFGLSL